MYLEVCKFDKKILPVWIFFLRIPLHRIPRQVGRVQIWRSWYFFKRDIQPRGKSTAKNAWKYHKLQSSANFFAQRGFMGIFNMSFLIPCRTNWHQKSFDINFFRVQPFSYQPICKLNQQIHALTLAFCYSLKKYPPHPYTRETRGRTTYTCVKATFKGTIRVLRNSYTRGCWGLPPSIMMYRAYTPGLCCSITGGWEGYIFRKKIRPK